MKKINRKALLIVLLLIFAIAAVIYILNNRQQASESEFVGKVFINEAMTSNKSAVMDEYGNYSDWIELYNLTDQPIDLSDWQLADDKSEKRYAFNNVILEPGFMVIYCSGTASNEEDLHVNFKLNSQGETITISDPMGHVVDTIQVPSIPTDQSYSRSFADLSTWSATQDITPGFENSQTGALDYQKSLVTDEYPILISEIQPNNKMTLPDEFGNFDSWIELYNASDESIDISGFYLTDNKNDLAKWTFPQGTVISGREYMLVFAGGKLDENQSPIYLHADFSLSSFEESVIISSRKGQIIDSVDYSQIDADFVYQRDPQTSVWEVSSMPSPGFINDETGHQNYKSKYEELQKHNTLYFSEIKTRSKPFNSYMNDPIDEERYYDWIEIHNPTGSDLDISGYGISDNTTTPNKWRFEQGTVIKAGEYKLLYAPGYEIAASKKKSNYVNFGLGNSIGEILTLWDNSNNLIDKMAYPSIKNFMSYGRDANLIDSYFTSPTPGEPNAQGYHERAATPTFSQIAGLYNATQLISITNHNSGEIYYTLDGSEPTKNSNLYANPVEISNTTVLRAKTIVDGMLPSFTSSATYIINSPHSNKLSIVSLSTDDRNFYDPDVGIYVGGTRTGNLKEFLVDGNAVASDLIFNANFWQEWERPVHFEIFDTNGQLEFSADSAIRIFGAYSRLYQQKGFALIARSEYGPSSFDHAFFENRDIDSYKSIILRASGQENQLTKIRDIVATSLVDGTTNLKTQAYRQAVVYLNGKYFGIYNIREKVTKYFLAEHYNLKNPDNIDLLVGNGEVLVGDDIAYKTLLDYCNNNDLSDAAFYKYVTDRIDIENYIDYLICEMYTSNTDTGNIKFFRERSNDPEKSKWRWIYYDFCWSFEIFNYDPVDNYLNSTGHGVGDLYSNDLARALFKNEEFTNKFLLRFNELLNTVYTPENVKMHINTAADRIFEEKERDSERWNGSSFETWQNRIELMREFADKQPERIIYFIQKNFNLSDDKTIEIFGRLGTNFEQ